MVKAALSLCSIFSWLVVSLLSRAFRSVFCSMAVASTTWPLSNAALVLCSCNRTTLSSLPKYRNKADAKQKPSTTPAPMLGLTNVRYLSTWFWTLSSRPVNGTHPAREMAIGNHSHCLDTQSLINALFSLSSDDLRAFGLEEGDR
jgi:hypothetical protein